MKVNNPLMKRLVMTSFLLITASFVFSQAVNFDLWDELPASSYRKIWWDDLDHDGFKELTYCMEDPRIIVSYEWRPLGSHIPPHFFWLAHQYDGIYSSLMAVGDSDCDWKSELFTQGGQDVKAYEALSSSGFPELNFWNGHLTAAIVTRMSIQNLDNDSYRELLFCGKTLDTDPEPQGAFAIYEYRPFLPQSYVTVFNSGQYPAYHKQWVGEVPVGDFDGDGSLEVVLSSLYGEIAILESTGNNQYQFTWDYQAPVYNMYEGTQLNDINGNGKNEFVVGGMNFSFGQPGYHYFAMFESDGNDSYQLLYDWYFYEGSGFSHEGGAAAGDTNGDGIDELALSTGEHIFIYSFVQNAEVPINIYTFPVYGNKGWVYMYDINSDGKAEILFNNFDTLTLEIYRRNDTLSHVELPID